MSQRFKMHLERAKCKFVLLSVFLLKLYKPITNVMPLSLLFGYTVHVSPEDENIYSLIEKDNSLYP